MTFYKNLNLIIFALAISISLWVTITYQQNPDITDVFQGIPVEVQNVPATLIARGQPPQVKVKIITASDVWRSLRPNSFRAFVDAFLEDAGVDELSVRIDSADPRVRIIDIQPERVSLRFELLETKTIPVSVNLTDNVPFGYTSEAPIVTPTQVTVSGAQSLVEEVADAVVDVRFEGRKTTFSQMFKTVPRNRKNVEIQELSMVPQMVSVEIPVKQEVSYKAVPITPTISGAMAAGYQTVGLTIEPSIVTVVGAPAVLNDITYLATRPVDITGAASDLIRDAELILPQGVSVAQRQRVIVRVRVNPIESTQTLNLTPTIEGLNDTLEAIVVPSTIAIGISGPMPTLSVTKATDFQAIIDVNGLSAGSYSLSPRVSIPSSLRLNQVSPEKISIIIRRK